MHSSTRYAHDVEGYMVHSEHWNEEFARLLSANENLELTEAHWMEKILNA